MPIDANLFRTAKAWEIKLLGEDARLKQITNQMNMTLKVLHDCDIKLHHQTNPDTIKRLANDARKDLAQLKSVIGGKLNPAYASTEKFLMDTNIWIGKVMAVGKVFNDRQAMDWANKAGKLVHQTRADLASCKLHYQKCASDLQAFSRVDYLK